MAKDVIIVGAGISGIYAGYLLKAQGYEVSILEAKKRAGGRILALENFADFPVELGAGYIHGHKNLLVDYLDYLQVPIQEVPQRASRIFNGKKLLTIAQSEGKKKLKKALNLYETIYKYKGEEKTAHEFLSKKKYFKKTEQILEGLTSEYGTDLRKIGMKSTAQSDKLWHSGERDYVLPKTFWEVFQDLYSEIETDLSLNTVVKSVDYTSDRVIITDLGGTTHEAKQAIICVPLSVLKSQSINFYPTLPAPKQEAIQQIGFDLGMKVLLKFSEPFWQEPTTFVFGGKECPSYEVISMGRESQEYIICAYLMGKFAHKFGQMEAKEREKVLLADLSELFAQSVENTFMGSYTQDWSKEPHIWGAYSFNAPHSFGMREILAKPLDNKLFFAGEATHFDGHHATVHGAMEIAEWVVEIITKEEESIMNEELRIYKE